VKCYHINLIKLHHYVGEVASCQFSLHYFFKNNDSKIWAIRKLYDGNYDGSLGKSISIYVENCHCIEQVKLSATI
jgi:hypothetical protein